MKVQMQDQSLRIRISEAELARLQSGETIGNVTRLPGHAGHHQAVQLVDGDEPSLVSTGERWIYQLPRHQLDSYVGRLPCRDALTARLPVGEGMDLSVDFEVDVRDSVRSRGTPRRGVQSRKEADRGLD